MMENEPFSRARVKMQFWKSSFLDLSFRNNQLNFNPYAKDIIEVIHQDSSALFKILLIMQQTFSFPSVYSPPKRKTKAKKNSEISPSPKMEISCIPSQIQGKLSAKHIRALNKKSKDLRLTELLTYETDPNLIKKIQKLQNKTEEMLEERGINTLFLTLGLLHWQNSQDKKKYISPIMFIPVSLSVNPPELNILDDEVIINPALKEKLRDYRIKIPNFPEEFNTRTFINYFEEFEQLIQDMKDWKIEHRNFISTFAFTKVNLFEDIDDHADLLISHPIIKAIAEEKGYKESSENLPDLSLLHDSSDPKHQFTLLDCDSSQMEAILYAKSGCSLVIQGPPGTGKSQCITNIIGECLAEGKKVLFVAQKKAALDVVKKRLDSCGIGDFCLQVHSQNANKKELLQSIQNTLDKNFPKKSLSENKFHDLIQSRQRLNEYVELINQPFGKMQKSLYQIVGKMLKFKNIPKIVAPFRDPNQVNFEDYTFLKNTFGELDQFRTTMENFSKNPWYSAKITHPLILSGELKVVLKKRLTSFRDSNLTLQENIRHFILKFPPKFEQNPDLITEWQHKRVQIRYWIEAMHLLFPFWLEMEEGYQDLRQYFDIDSLVDYQKMNFDSFRQIYIAYCSDKGNSRKFISKIEKKLRLYADSLQKFQDVLAVFNLKSCIAPIQTLEELNEVKTFFDRFLPRALLLPVDILITRFTTDYLSWGKRLSAVFREDRKKILLCRRKGRKHANPMGYLNQIKVFQDKFGKPYDHSLSEISDMITEFHILYSEWEALYELEQELLPFFRVSFLPSTYEQSLWEKNHIFAQQWLDNLPYLNDWFEVQVRAIQIADLGFSSLFRALLDEEFYIPGDHTPISYELIFLHSFYAKWLEILTDSLPPIANFERNIHEKHLKKFRERDVEVLQLNQKRLENLLADARPQSEFDLSPEILTQIGYIRREAKKKRNIKPLRHIFGDAQELITKITPCLLMSPLSIANYLDLEKYYRFFDVVIFDEASQVTPEDAIGAIARGKSLVVVGDSEQLPPTQFFTSKKSDDDLDDSLDSEIQTMESLLDECTGIGFREKMLRFHYRSKKEGLIAFSNFNFYNGKLYSFPDISNYSKQSSKRTQIKNNLSASLNSTSGTENYAEIHNLPAIEFRHIPKGVKDKGKNPIEAKAVAKTIIQHYINNQISQTQYSLGVVAFSIVQQAEIQSALQKLLKNQPDVEEYMNTSQIEPLFIKNLENVQGDERDFIFFSIGYTRDVKGNFSLNFGPLNRTGGYRRLNVAITRARYHIKLFASFLPSEIPIGRVKARGLRELIAYMHYARSQTLPKMITTKNQNTKDLIDDDSLEADILESLKSEGFQVVPKVGISNIRIDLAIVHPNDPNRFILGIECDGGSYAEAVNARDRDRIRYNVLTGLGWEIIHVWTPEWIKNKQKIIQRIKRKITSIVHKDP
ncbi:DUF4011 domain-containing protein [Candidatus Harpocratesius sp.]